MRSEIKKTPRRIASVVVIVAIAGVACANKTASGSREPSAVPPRIDSAGSDTVLTVDRILQGTPEESAAYERLAFEGGDLAVQSCMADAGFADEYVPARMFQGPPHVLPDVFSDPVGDEGWGIVTGAADRFNIEDDSAGEPIPSKEYSDALSACEDVRFEVADAVPFPPDQLSEKAQADLISASHAVWTDPDFFALHDKYVSCMAELGVADFELAPAIDELIDLANSAANAGDTSTLAALEDEERSMAAADAACRTPLLTDLRAARERVESAAIEAHREEVDAVLAAWKDVLDKAPTRAQVASGVHP